VQINKPLYIVIDGIDGCGKTTQAKLLEERLRQNGMSILHTREPGGTKTGAEIRKLLISTEYDLEPESELLLLGVDRLEHQRKKVIPALEKGVTVISDRYESSTYAYQVCGRGLKAWDFYSTSSLTVMRQPDIILIIDLEPETALDRALSRLRAEDKLEDEGKFEQLGIDFYMKVRKGFREYAENHKNAKIIDGMKDMMAVAEDIYGYIRDKI